MGAFRDLTGATFGRWRVLSRSETAASGKTKWLCECECGTRKIVHGCALTEGRTQSCGCICRENPNHVTHHATGTRLYKVWVNVIQRCCNPKSAAYKNYGKRGIQICKEWRDSFESFQDWAFCNGYEGELTLERIDNDSDYSPENCKWATRKEQAYNRRTNHCITFRGETKTLSEWAEIIGISQPTLRHRLGKLGWSIDMAMTTPLKGVVM